MKYIKHEKNLLRTLNTFSEYEDVNILELDFDLKKNKFTITMKEEYSHIDNNSSMLIYDSIEANENKKDISEISEILNSGLFKQLFKSETIHKYKELIYKYNKSKNINTFFLNDKEKMIEEIKNVLSYDKSYEHPTSKKEVFTKDFVAKRLYYTLYNRLNFFITDIEKTIKKVKARRMTYQEKIRDEFNVIQSKISRTGYFKSSRYEIDSTYKDIVIALELHDNPNFSIKELFPTHTLQMLLDEKTLLEEDIEASFFIESIKYFLDNYFSDYIRVKTYLDSINLPIEKKNIRFFFKDLIYLKKRHEKLGGLKRKKKLLEIETKFSVLWRELLKISKENKVDYFIEKMILIDKEFGKAIHTFEEQDKINILKFSYKKENKENLPFKYTRIITKEEMKYYDDYCEYLEQLSKLNSGIPDNENTELIEQKDYFENKILELDEKYSTRPLHPYAEEYLNNKVKDKSDLEEYYMDAYENNIENEYRKYLKEIGGVEFIKYIISEVKMWCKTPFILGTKFLENKKSFNESIFREIKIKEQKYFITIERLKNVTW
jgi:hypothetical protein